MVLHVHIMPLYFTIHEYNINQFPVAPILFPLMTPNTLKWVQSNLNFPDLWMMVTMMIAMTSSEVKL